MAIRKCPRCELNYITDNEKICSVCRREVRGESEHYEMIELCSECGENPVVPGKELCAECLKEQQRHSSVSTDDSVTHEGANVGIDSVSTMDEIELDLYSDSFDEDEEDFEDEDDFDEEDED